jgi:hypothetical protein
MNDAFARRFNADRSACANSPRQAAANQALAKFSRTYMPGIRG